MFHKTLPENYLICWILLWSKVYDAITKLHSQQIYCNLEMRIVTLIGEIIWIKVMILKFTYMSPPIANAPAKYSHRCRKENFPEIYSQIRCEIQREIYMPAF